MVSPGRWGETVKADKARRIAIEILDGFEELLVGKGLMIPSEDREGRPEEACLYGSEYYLLEDTITDLLVKETQPTSKRKTARRR